MKPALQAILISPDSLVRLAIMLGKKKITIREGHRDYHEGPVMICCHIDPWAVMATITSVRHTTLAEVTREEYTADGYSSQVQMLEDLRQYYPNMTMESDVTVISWDKVTGALTELDHIKFYAEINGIEDYLQMINI
jgi:hypothetical protein